MLAFGCMLAFQFFLRGTAPPVAVAYPPGVPEFERAAAPHLASGAWVRFSGVGGLRPGQVVYTFGARAALDVAAPGHEIVELFVAGRVPHVEGHRHVSWEAPVEAWDHLLAQFEVVRAGLPFCLLTTPRLQGDHAPAAPRNTRIILLRDAVEALVFAAALERGRHACGGIVLAADFEVLDARVFDLLARLQTRAWIPLFGRTRHEVLLGAVAAVEPQVEGWDSPEGISMGGQVFYNKHVAAWFGVGALLASARWRTQALVR